MVFTREKESCGGKGIKYMVTKEDLTLGGGHIMKYIDDVWQNCTLETYKILLTIITPINFTLENGNDLNI